MRLHLLVGKMKFALTILGKFDETDSKFYIFIDMQHELKTFHTSFLVSFLCKLSLGNETCGEFQYWNEWWSRCEPCGICANNARCHNETGACPTPDCAPMFVPPSFCTNNLKGKQIKRSQAATMCVECACRVYRF